MSHLKVESLGKDFVLHMLGGRRLTAFEEVSFSVERGEFLGVLGRSGSGKSSLLRCIYRRYLPTSGNVFFESKEGLADLASVSDREMLRLREREIGYVSQFFSAIPRTPAVDVVAEPLVVRGEGAGAARERASEVMRSLGLPEELHEAFPATMSGGEKQRVNLARALVGRPDLLLLDEPTSALDLGTRSLAIEAIGELKAAGVTMVGIFHDLDSLRALADNALVMEGGLVRWIGPASEATDLVGAV